MDNIKTSKAFTLAEVLITLVIIGVVAALTIPTVVNNYQEKAFETQKRKVQSTLANGFKLLMAEDGVTSLKDTKLGSCKEDGACYAKEINRVFNIASDINNNPEIFKINYKFSDGTYDMLNGHLWYEFATTDGMLFAFNKRDDSISLIVDLNGIKNPNTGGKDPCKFDVYSSGKIIEKCEQMVALGR